MKSVLKSIGYKHQRWGFEAVRPSPTVTAEKTPAGSADKVVSALEKIKDKCTELGFTKGTEKHGNCVMKLYK